MISMTEVQNQVSAFAILQLLVILNFFLGNLVTVIFLENPTEEILA